MCNEEGERGREREGEREGGSEREVSFQGSSSSLTLGCVGPKISFFL